ncbi:MAG TPA: hypothetical protein EYG81_02600 [Archaeoglobus profundus]|nr:hypothetical protein [Archaeoglobus profundus]
MSRLTLTIGGIIGFLFGFNGIATLFSLLGKTLTEVQQLLQMEAISTLILFIIAVILILKVRVISTLIVGAVIGAIINTILELYGIHATNYIYNFIVQYLPQIKLIIGYLKSYIEI